MRYLLTLLLLGISMLHSYATSRQGGYITYEHIANDSFQVTLVLYSECDVPPSIFGGTLPIQVSSSCITNPFTATLQKQNGALGTITSLICDSIPNSCNGGSGLSRYNKHVYSGVVVLNTPCTDWTFSYNTCCTPNADNFLGIGGSSPTSAGIDIFAVANTVAGPTNSSPQFNVLGNQQVCSNSTINYAAGATDPNGHTLRYSLDSPPLTPPLTGYNVPTGLTLDSITGDITYTTPMSLGRYYIFVKIEDVDATGQVLGFVRHMLSFSVINCSTSSNTPPAQPSPFLNVGGTAVQSAPTTVDLCANGNVCFDLNFQDVDSWQTLTPDLTSLQAALPGANITTSGTNPLTVSVCWTPPTGVTGNRDFAVSVADSACVLSAYAARSYRVRVVESVKAIADSVGICPGGSGQLQVLALDSLIWSVIAGDPITPNNFSCDSCWNPIVSPSQPTTYQVQSTGTSACPGVDTIHVYFLPVPQFGLDRSGDSICVGDSTVFTVANVQPMPYSVSALGTAATRISGDSVWVTPSQTGLAEVGITVTANQCSATDSVFVWTTPGVGQVSIIATDTQLCEGESVSLTAQVSTGNNQVLYGWMPGSFIGQVYTDSPTATTTYVVVAADTVGNCTGSAIVQIAVSPMALLTASPDQTVCPNTPFDVQAMATGGVPPFTYNWSSSTSTSSISTQQVANDTSIVVSATDAFGCITNKDTIDVMLPAPLIAQLPADTTVSPGTSLTICVSGGGGLAPFTATWSTGQQSATCINLTTGTTDTTVVVSITDDCGTTAQDTMQITVIGSPGTGVDENGKISGIRFYPNPVGSVLYWTTTDGAPDEPMTIHLYDATGRMVATYQTRARNGNWEIPNLPAGWYTLSYSLRNEVYRQPLLKQ